MNPPISQPISVAAPAAQRQSDPPSSLSSRPQGQPSQPVVASQPPQPTHMNQPFAQQPPSAVQQHERSFSQGPNVPMQQQQYGAAPSGGPPRGPSHGAPHGSGSVSTSGPPQLSSLPFQTSQPPPQQSFQSPLQAHPAPYSQPPPNLSVANLPPVKPVFGLSLEQLFERDQSAVPMVVYQCIQAVDLFGLEVEGIYRLSGTSSHIKKIKAMFDNGKYIATVPM